MGDNSKISWTDASWNPVTGCTKVSAGCANCYIVDTPPFRKQGRTFERVGNTMTTGVTVHYDRLDIPLRWSRPRKIFVNSMSDLFHEGVSFEFIAGVFAVMSAASQHTFQVLTKRPERAREFFDWLPGHYAGPRRHDLEDLTSGYVRQRLKDAPEVPWPFPNVWLGVSTENQHFADQRIPILLSLPAAVHFISAEPLLKPINVAWAMDSYWNVDGMTRNSIRLGMFNSDQADSMKRPTLDWVIVGGESGRNARPMKEEWATDIRDQCEVGEVPFFFKQWGGAKPGGEALLDGREHLEFPA